MLCLCLVVLLTLSQKGISTCSCATFTQHSWKGIFWKWLFWFKDFQQSKSPALEWLPHRDTIQFSKQRNAGALSIRSFNRHSACREKKACLDRVMKRTEKWLKPKELVTKSIWVLRFISLLFRIKKERWKWLKDILVLSTHSNKAFSLWNKFIHHVLRDLAGGGENMEVEVINWSIRRLVEPQPVEKTKHKKSMVWSGCWQASQNTDWEITGKKYEPECHLSTWLQSMWAFKVL